MDRFLNLKSAVFPGQPATPEDEALLNGLFAPSVPGGEQNAAAGGQGIDTVTRTQQRLGNVAVDGVMKPGGETSHQVNTMIAENRKAAGLDPHAPSGPWFQCRQAFRWRGSIAKFEK